MPKEALKSAGSVRPQSWPKAWVLETRVLETSKRGELVCLPGGFSVTMS